MEFYAVIFDSYYRSIEPNEFYKSSLFIKMNIKV